MTTKKYCNVCGMDVSEKSYLRIDSVWENTNWMTKFEPSDVTLCETCAKEFIAKVCDEGQYQRWLKNKERCMREQPLHHDPVLRSTEGEA